MVLALFRSGRPGGVQGVEDFGGITAGPRCVAVSEDSACSRLRGGELMTWGPRSLTER